VPDDGRYTGRQPRSTQRGRAAHSADGGTDRGRDLGAAAARDAGRHDHWAVHGTPPGGSARRHDPADRHDTASRSDSAVPAVLLKPASSRHEFLVPSSVILAGVLAVVAVAVALNWGMRRADDVSAQPVVPPPVIGAQPLAPAGEWNLPTPAPSRPTGARPSTTPSGDVPGRDGTPRPPSRSKVEDPPPNALAIGRSDVPRTVDLSAEGTRDWVHWGLTNTFSLERRKTGGFAILEGTPDAPRHRHALSPQRFVWKDGAPVTATSGTANGIRTCGARNGFTLTTASGTDYRTLRIYAGVKDGRGRLTAMLSTGGTTVAGSLEARGPMRTAVFTLSFKSPRKGTLTVTWVTERSDDPTCGGVALQAATLR
jgi:hypothetical protein